MRLSRLVLTLTLCLSTLPGCNNLLSMDRDKPLSPYQQCLELRRQLIFYSTDNNHNTDWSTPAKRLSLLQDYQSNDCTEILRKTSSRFWD